MGGAPVRRGHQAQQEGTGARQRGGPSTHPAEGRDQGQQSSRDAVLVQGGAVLWERGALGAAPSRPARRGPQEPPRASGQEAPSSESPPHPGPPQPWAQPEGASPRGNGAPRPPPSPGLRQQQEEAGLTCRQQFMMRTMKSNCWWSSTARFCCTCRCSSCVRQRRAARPFRALSTAGSSWRQGNMGLGASKHALEGGEEGGQGTEPGSGRARDPQEARAQAVSTEGIWKQSGPDSGSSLPHRLTSGRPCPLYVQKPAEMETRPTHSQGVLPGPEPQQAPPPTAAALLPGWAPSRVHKGPCACSLIGFHRKTSRSPAGPSRETVRPGLKLAAGGGRRRGPTPRRAGPQTHGAVRAGTSVRRNGEES